MRCFYHPEVDSVVECRICGHPLCQGCRLEIKGGSYCGDCLEARLKGGQPPVGPFAGTEPKSPKVAGWLSILPGLGLVYLGLYLKALVVGLIFIGTLHIAHQTDLGGPLTGFWFFAKILYAVQEARRLNRLRAGMALVQEPAIPDEKESPFWGAVQVGIGALFLLDQFDLIRFGQIFEKFWPVLIIALGLQILLRGRGSGAHAAHP